MAHIEKYYTEGFKGGNLGLGLAGTQGRRGPFLGQRNHTRSGKKKVLSMISIHIILEKIEKELVKVSTTRSKHDIIMKKKIQGNQNVNDKTPFKGRGLRGNHGFPLIWHSPHSAS